MSGPDTTGWDDGGGEDGAGWPVIPGYEVDGVLGRGGMGVVYSARDLAAGRPVALKVLRAGALAGPHERARFRAEAETAARVRHPNVVAVYEVGTHDGVPFLAMERVDGGGLDRRLAAGPLPPHEAAGLVRTLARAAQHAHDARVVHRDLKPANVLLGPDGPKVADFGLAKRLDPDATALTRAGAVLGTAGYMAPEQAAGGGAAVGPAADVWALGAVLYECLTGRPPFRADSWEGTLALVIAAAPLPPAAHNPAVPPAVEAICLRCLEKAPDRRYPRAADLADDLDRFLAGRAATVGPLTAGERLARVAAADGFTLLGEVGRGPHATVYRAAAGAGGPPLAVKVFEGGPRERWREWFNGAAARWAAVAHPHVLPPLHRGWWGDAPYVAREYAPLGSVAVPTGGPPQPLAAVLRLVVQLTEVVGYLHRQGLTHGGLKPANILLAAGGIPRLADPRPPGGLVVGGEAGFLAPELAADPAAEPRPHTDVYGLAAVLYGLLTGRPPDPAVPPSAHRPDLPPELDRLCARGLRADPWARPPRAYDLLRQFRPLLAEAEGADAARRGRRPG
ncbi:MAG TPA: protein kinase [Urbifossiella sp.]|jgi:serine/threonine protein kinase|nr:protein kinase [Urbifossiella sp.]